MRKPSVMKQVTAALIAALIAGPASAWTDKAVKLVVPAPPGGTADTATRIIAEQVSAEMGDILANVTPAEVSAPALA